MADRDLYVEVEHFQVHKHSEPVPGDVFLSRKVPADDRVVSVLADGLGSGVKANVLATLTSTMALEFVADGTDIEQAARTVMGVLPVCKVRQIAYSTFTIVDIVGGHQVRVIEHENPPFFVLRGSRLFEPECNRIALPPGVGNVQRERHLEVANFTANDGDRLVYFTDGVNQSGMGEDRTPLGLGRDAVIEFARHLVTANADISARELARRIVDLGIATDGGQPHDDISCGVVYFRQPRHLLLATGPPFSKKSDTQMAETVAEFDGTRIVSGGTTAAIISRELGRPVTMDMDLLDDEVPPISHMEGINLVTEGTITLARVLDMLERNVNPDHEPRNGATFVLEYLLNSDVIQFLVGTKINEAHQDPNIPVELDLRRNLMKRIARLLEERHLKETKIQYI
jgi:hypothetical protein